ncbi:dTDP-4-amino-4,6-dideoxygalactose transaminase [Christensenella timonensis]|uniref:dTDP-4-amino-4,6-dideoxygalactose transaminase n=1 Tax=Christensenella timonensis TaxID=1816678 RepID=UPI0008375C9A|nr:dTDP-4-amino-4,6-dideoxygalactose transaminase [Christensenella timonensis]
MIRFNIPPCAPKSLEYVKKAVENHQICGDGEFTQRCSQWLKLHCMAVNVFLTTSCTHALEMAALLCSIMPGDEVIMPSYTFVSTANAFVLRGAKIVFVDIRPDTMNIDERLVEDAITERTKVIVPVHYAGIPCEMDELNRIAKKHGLLVVEDAAQAVLSRYHGKAAGTLGDFGCFSFHETKNFSMGEGGALLFNSPEYTEEAEIIREKGTNRSKFFRGQVDKYTWMDCGSSYLPSDINAAYLLAQLEQAKEIVGSRMDSWNHYHTGFEKLSEKGLVERPVIPDGCTHNAHMYYIKVKDLGERTELISFLQSKYIETAFHYIPLHNAPAGKEFGRFHGEDRYTTVESERLLRLPLYYDMNSDDIQYVIRSIYEFYLHKGTVK